MKTHLLLAVTLLMAAAPARAQFVAEYPEAQDPVAARMRQGLMEQRSLELLSRGLNRWIRMPRPVPLRMVECTASDIRWNADEHAVEICYRMAIRLHGIAAGQDSLRPAVGGAYMFMTLHGVAHAILEELDVPGVDDAEAAVDELAALLIIAAIEGETEIALYFLQGISTLQRADPRWGEWTYATAHGLGPQRFQNVACLIYGANPDRFGELRREGMVPAGAQQRCRTAGSRLLSVWSRRLARHLR